MALKPLDPIGDDAFVDGFLNKKRAQEIVDRLNTPMVIKMDGAEKGRVDVGTENIVFNLTPIFGEMRLCLLAVDGGLRYGLLPIKLV